MLGFRVISHRTTPSCCYVCCSSELKTLLGQLSLLGLSTRLAQTSYTSACPCRLQCQVHFLLPPAAPGFRDEHGWDLLGAQAPKDGQRDRGQGDPYVVLTSITEGEGKVWVALA